MDDSYVTKLLPIYGSGHLTISTTTFFSPPHMNFLLKMSISFSTHFESRKKEVHLDGQHDYIDQSDFSSHGKQVTFPSC